ncbi:hypothetical protein BS78_01G441100 [Paspalum vaginatum]|nr:hypothetical protein BS78_01G441100 [Paspalum vaginatum]
MGCDNDCGLFGDQEIPCVLLDSPGHKDFVPNMISGATQADAAILVVDASTGSFEAGMDGEGGKVNKMDAVAYSKERFEFIKLQLGSFLRSCNFKGSASTWIPLSAVENQKLIKPPSDAHLISWYQGFCLLEAIHSQQLPSQDVSKPLIIPKFQSVMLSSLNQQGS